MICFDFEVFIDPAKMVGAFSPFFSWFVSLIQLLPAELRLRERLPTAASLVQLDAFGSSWLCGHHTGSAAVGRVLPFVSSAFTEQEETI